MILQVNKKKEIPSLNYTIFFKIIICYWET